MTEPQLSRRQAIKQAWKRCNPFYARVNETLWYLTQKLSDLRNRPDPPPERELQEIAQAVEQVQESMQQYAAAGDRTVAELWQQLGSAGGLRSADPVPALVDMTRLRPHDGSHEQTMEQDGKARP